MPSAWMTEEPSLLRDATAGLLARELAPRCEQWDRVGAVDHLSWKKPGEAGLLCPSIAEAYAGSGGNFAHDIVVQEKGGRAGRAGIAVVTVDNNCSIRSTALFLARTAPRRTDLGGA